MSCCSELIKLLEQSNFGQEIALDSFRSSTEHSDRVLKALLARVSPFSFRWCYSALPTCFVAFDRYQLFGKLKSMLFRHKNLTEIYVWKPCHLTW